MLITIIVVVSLGCGDTLQVFVICLSDYKFILHCCYFIKPCVYITRIIQIATIATIELLQSNVCERTTIQYTYSAIHCTYSIDTRHPLDK